MTNREISSNPENYPENSNEYLAFLQVLQLFGIEHSTFPPNTMRSLFWKIQHGLIEMKFEGYEIYFLEQLIQINILFDDGTDTYRLEELENDDPLLQDLIIPGEETQQALLRLFRRLNQRHKVFRDVSNNIQTIKPRIEEVATTHNQLSWKLRIFHFDFYIPERKSRGYSSQFEDTSVRFVWQKMIELG